jgi:ABC-type Fe3+ transport system substrate-binding protein
VVEQESDEDQRVLLELAAGQHDYDVLIMGPSSYFDFLEYCEDINMQALVDEGVLTVPDGMINEAQPNTIATGSEMVGNAYNPELVSEEDAPKTYEDFLDPKWKGKIIVNPEAEHVAFLMNEDSWGPETTLDFAEELLANDPVWTDGSIAGLTLMASGEHPLFLMPNYHSALRVQGEQPGKVEVALIEPIGVALQSLNCVRSGSESPAASVLFLEYWASADGQKIMDDIGPVKGSIYAEDSIINDSTEGKETVVYGWEQIANDDAAGWTQQIVELWGFPTAPES